MGPQRQIPSSPVADPQTGLLTVTSQLVHDMNTMLSIIQGAAQLARLESGCPIAAPYVEQILENARHLGRLTEDILSLSQLELGNLPILLAPVSLADEVQKCCRAYKLLCSQKGLAFSVQVQAPVPERVHTDSLRLQQVFSNLLSNAVKYTAVGVVLVRVDFRNGVFRFRVDDTGCGIAPEDCERVFEPFGVAGDGATSPTRHGLGLALSRNLARLMGGDIQIVRSETGKGSSFEFTLPLSV